MLKPEWIGCELFQICVLCTYVMIEVSQTKVVATRLLTKARVLKCLNHKIVDCNQLSN